MNNVRKPENGNADQSAAKSETERMLLPDELEKQYKDMPLTEDTTCGLWIFKGRFFQMFANKKAFVLIYGISGCIFSATFSYFNGTLSTMEKRFQIPSRNTGIISVGNDISQLFVSLFLCYYGGRGHRPRWIGFGLFSIVLFCFLNALPHFLYGAGDNALQLTSEYGNVANISSADADANEKRKILCNLNSTAVPAECNTEGGNIAAQVILFIAQMVSGIGVCTYYTIGMSYFDDNIKQSKTPALMSISYFMRMLGPAVGLALASVSLKLYISPSLTPVIDNNDPRWLGAWWLGWIIIGVTLAVLALLTALFPRTLPRAAMRTKIDEELVAAGLRKKQIKVDEIPASLKDMITTCRRLFKNRVFMLNNVACFFYIFGYMPYWIFMPKYIEVLYRKSASESNMVTGTVGLVFSAIGILLSGIVLSKFRPGARMMAMWNIVAGVVSIAGLLGYMFIGCEANDNSVAFESSDIANFTQSCNELCGCEYTKYTPICGEDNMTYISPCHAGCLAQDNHAGDGSKIYTNCSCISAAPVRLANATVEPFLHRDRRPGGFAVAGFCPVDCSREFLMFIAVVCVVKFIGASARTTNFLISIRCVEKRDKSLSMGLSLMMMSLFALIPSPIFFGWLIDKTCIVWGKTCTGTGNCWLYDAVRLRHLNLISSTFVAIGLIFDVLVWVYIKGMQMFGDDDNDFELKELSPTPTTAELKSTTLVATPVLDSAPSADHSPTSAAESVDVADEAKDCENVQDDTATTEQKTAA